MLPINLLEQAINKPIVVELKNGSKCNGELEKCDRAMNVHLKNVVLTRPNGERSRASKVVIRGSSIRCFAVEEGLLKKER
ncbi:U6 snRNA-associated Sm-like protein LSm4 [Entamoeba marina]